MRKGRALGPVFGIQGGHGLVSMGLGFLVSYQANHDPERWVWRGAAGSRSV